MALPQSVFPNGNPWMQVNYSLAGTPNSPLGWIFPPDQNALQAHKKLSNISLGLDPVPWGGRWDWQNDDLPLLVILGLNPGSGYHNANGTGSSLIQGNASNAAFSNLVNKNLSGKAGLGEQIFSQEMDMRKSYCPSNCKMCPTGSVVRSGSYPQCCNDILKLKSYWLQRLYSLYKAVFGNQAIKKSEIYKLIRGIDKPNVSQNILDKTKYFFDLILTVELFPYHTVKGAQIGSLFKTVKINGIKARVLKYPSSEINAALVRYLIDQNVTVIAARSRRNWADALGSNSMGLLYIKKCLHLSNPRQIYISEANLIEDAWNGLVSQFQKKLNLPIP